MGSLWNGRPDAADWPPEHGWQIESVDGWNASECLQQRIFQRGPGIMNRAHYAWLQYWHRQLHCRRASSKILR